MIQAFALYAVRALEQIAGNGYVQERLVGRNRRVTHKKVNGVHLSGCSKDRATVGKRDDGARDFSA